MIIGRDRTFVPPRKLDGHDLGQELRNRAVHEIQALFVLFDLLRAVKIAVQQDLRGEIHIFAGEIRHVHDGALCLRNRDGRRLQKAVVEERFLLFFLFAPLLVRHDFHRELDKQVDEREKYRYDQNFEQRMEVRDLAGHIFSADKHDKVFDLMLPDPQGRQKQESAEAVEQQVNYRRAPRVGVGADAGEQRGDAGSDIRSQDHEHRHAEGHRARKGDQNSRHGGRTLDDRSHDKPDQKRQKGHQRIARILFEEFCKEGAQRAVFQINDRLERDAHHFEPQENQPQPD